MKQESLFSRPQNALQPAAAKQVFGVSRVVAYIKRLLEENKNLASVRVRGEISDLRERPGGLLYFDLKENDDILKCVVWSNTAAKLPPIKDGIEVICDGTFSIYKRYAQYQLIVNALELSGIGALYAQFEALREKFSKEGLFDKARKRPMPLFPTRVAVVSAQDGRGAGDFVTTLAREAPFVEIVPVPTRVEGDGAEIDVAEAIDKASRMDVDVIVITRGGGSYESLFTFNREPVLRAIVRAKRPILSAIGHTEDVLLSDFVADYTCETPSNAAHYFGEIGKRHLTRIRTAEAKLERAAERITVAHAQRLGTAASRLYTAVQRAVNAMKFRLHDLERRLSEQPPHAGLRARADRLTRLTSRLEFLSGHATAAQGRRLEQSSRRLEQISAGMVAASQQRFQMLCVRLDASNPRSPLERGYAIVTMDGRTVRDASAVPAGAAIEAQVQRGKLLARVEGKEDDA